MSLLVLVDNKDDLLYKHIFDDKVNVLDLLVVCYGSIDILNTLIKTNKTNYFECIDTHKEFEVTAFVFNSFYKCFFVHKKMKNVKNFIFEVSLLFKEKIIYDDIWNYEDQIDQIDNIFKSFF